MLMGSSRVASGQHRARVIGLKSWEIRRAWNDGYWRDTGKSSPRSGLGRGCRGKSWPGWRGQIKGAFGGKGSPFESCTSTSKDRGPNTDAKAA